jgi:ribosomal protein S18 acetylase RimI-like enzyme
VEEHNFPPKFLSSELAITLVSEFMSHPDIYGVVAELDGGQVVGSTFVDERSIIAGIGPITVDPAVQNRAIGRELMQHVLARLQSGGCQGSDWSKQPIITARFLFTQS